MSFKKVGVLFVCLGNICRSPAAEGAFIHLAKEKELDGFFKIDSCGTAGYHVGEPPHETTRQVAASRGIILKHFCRQLTYQDFQNFDYILAMDESNLKNILRIAKTDSDRAKVHKFREFDHTVNGAPDVPDPYYGGLAGFEHVQDIVTRSSAGLLSWLIEKHSHLQIPRSEELEPEENFYEDDELVLFEDEGTEKDDY